MSFIDLDTLREMNKTAVEAAGAANKVKIIDLPKEPPGSYGVIDSSGALAVAIAKPFPREHRTVSFDDFIEAVSHYKEKGGFAPAVWYSPERIVAVLDDKADSRRLDKVTLPLDYTPGFRFFLNDAAGAWMPQKAFIRKLRVDLADCLTDSSSALLKAARVLSFNESQSGYGKVQLGSESLGRDIQEQVSLDQGEVPDQVTFSIRVFTDAGLKRRYLINCAVDVNPREGTFNIAPLPSQVQETLDEELQHVGERL